jgi:Mg-chelatase subunit ChlD
MPVPSRRSGRPGGRRRHAALLLVLAAAPGTLLGQALRAADPIGDLVRWTERLARTGGEPAFEDVERTRLLAAEARNVALADGGQRERAAGALLDLAEVAPEGRRAARGNASLESVRGIGRDELRTLLQGDGGRATTGWLAASVLARPASEPAWRRAGAARALEGLHLPSTRLALFAGALDEDPLVRAACQRALVGWQDDGVHRFLLDQAERGRRQLDWIEPRLVREHFANTRLALESPLAARVTAQVREALDGDDWRAAARAVELGRGLPDGLAVPVLIDAMRRWQARRTSGGGRLRIEADLAAELRRRSGRNIGPHPERWATWWRSRVAGAGEETPVPASPATAAGFFGLRPETDRVVFVLDRSGSMEAPFGAGDRSRYEEAVEQLCALLEALGPQARFRVILFSSGLRISGARLEAATAAQIASTRAWMLYRGPDGGTELEPAVREAMRLDARGRPDLEALEADTVVVLCDGETAEGPGWVRALLEGPNQEAALRFHCVQIGGGSDGTLEALAAGSAGSYLVVPD